MRDIPKPQQIYRHFKGGIYQIVSLAEVKRRRCGLSAAPLSMHSGRKHLSLCKLLKLRSKGACLPVTGLSAPLFNVRRKNYD